MNSSDSGGDAFLKVLQLSQNDDLGWHLGPQPKGQREKYHCFTLFAENPVEGVRSYYFKTSHPRYPLEFWSEVTAFHIARASGFEVPVCMPAILDGKYGSLSQDMLTLQTGSSLTHGAELMVRIDPDYDRNGKGESCTPSKIRKALRLLKLRSLYNSLFKIMIFDALIGNNDRHHENWGLLVTPTVLSDGSSDPVIRLCPAFDNGSSLLREFSSDTKLLQRLPNQPMIDSYIDRGLSSFHWEGENELKPLTHEQLLAKHFEVFPESLSLAGTVLEIDDELVRDAIMKVRSLSQDLPDREITVVRAETIHRIFVRRKERLVKLVESFKSGLS